MLQRKPNLQKFQDDDQRLSSSNGQVFCNSKVLKIPPKLNRLSSIVRIFKIRRKDFPELYSWATRSGVIWRETNHPGTWMTCPTVTEWCIVKVWSKIRKMKLPWNTLSSGPRTLCICGESDNSWIREVELEEVEEFEESAAGLILGPTLWCRKETKRQGRKLVVGRWPIAKCI